MSTVLGLQVVMTSELLPNVCLCCGVLLIRISDGNLQSGVRLYHGSFVDASRVESLDFAVSSGIHAVNSTNRFNEHCVGNFQIVDW